MPSNAGFFFFGLGAFFYALRYICAAIMYAGQSARIFSSFYSLYAEVGADLSRLALLFFVVGAVVLLFSPLLKVAQGVMQATEKTIHSNE